MQRLFVNPKYEPVFAQQGWSTFGRVVEHFFPNYTRRTKVTVQRVAIPTGHGDIDAFFKLYQHHASRWRFWMRASKARREFDNYGIFERLGLPAANRMACGEERNAIGLLQRAFIVTRTVPNAIELGHFLENKPPGSERRKVLRELANIVCRLHGMHFYYHDLVARNILVSRAQTGMPSNEADTDPCVFLIDCPRGGFARFGRDRKRLRDLASLDKTASQQCSRAERLRFLLRYAGKGRVDAEARALIQACIGYRRSRWPEDWRGK